MFVTVTVKAAPTSKEEANTLMQHFNALKDEGVFGPAKEVDVRYLFVAKQEVSSEEVPVEV